MTDPITRLNAALEGRYRVEREIGEGGMAREGAACGNSMFVSNRGWHVALLCGMSTAYLTFLGLARTSLGG